MKKRILAALLALCLLSLMPMAALAEETVKTNAKSGTCGEGLSWVLEGYTLTISGSGEMDDGDPWEAHKDHIEHVVLTGGVTSVGASAFEGYDRIETVDFGDALVEIGERAFYGCDDIDYIHLPATFRSFGAECFRDCYSLRSVYCDGGMPRFNDSCLWNGEYISVFYPTNNPWPTEYVSQLMSNFGGRLGIMMGNFDPALVEGAAETAEDDTRETTEATEAATEATEVTTPPTAAAEAATETIPAQTEAAEVVLICGITEPETTGATEPETTGATEPETQAPTAPETIEAPTEAPREEAEDLTGKSWIGLVMIAAVLVFLLSGAMIFRVVNRRGGRYGR